MATEYKLSYTAQEINQKLDKIDAFAEAFVTPQMFGAKADGVTDDTAAVQAALDNGGVIYFPAGVYKTTKQLTTTRACKIKMFKPYPSHFWRSKTTSGMHDYPIIIAEGERDYQEEKGWDFGARIECYPSVGEKYGLLIGDGVEVDGLFMRAMNGFTGVLLKYDGAHVYGTNTSGASDPSLYYKSYPSAMRFRNIRLDCDRHNVNTTIPEAMFDFNPVNNYFYILEDIVIGLQHQFSQYGFRSIIGSEEKTVWANSVRITNLCIDMHSDYPLYIAGTYSMSNWIIEGLSIQAMPYNYSGNPYEAERGGHKTIMTLKTMNHCSFIGCHIYDLYQAKFEKLFDTENLSDITCVGCSDEFYVGTKKILDYGHEEEPGIETFLKEQLQEVADNAKVTNLELDTETFEDGRNRISLSDAQGNSIHTDIPPLTLSNEQLSDGIGNWMDDNAMPKEVPGKNVFDINSIVMTTLNQTTGKPNTITDNMFTTDFIKVEPGDVLRHRNTDVFLSEGFGCYELYEFDKDKNYLRYTYNVRQMGCTHDIAPSKSGYTIENEDTAWVRISYPLIRLYPDRVITGESKLIITINNTDMTYEPYGSQLVGGLGQYFMLQSPTGEKYSVTVDEEGLLIAKPKDGSEPSYPSSVVTEEDKTEITNNVLANLPFEEWVFTLEDETTITKKVVVKNA